MHADIEECLSEAVAFKHKESGGDSVTIQSRSFEPGLARLRYIWGSWKAWSLLRLWACLTVENNHPTRCWRFLCERNLGQVRSPLSNHTILGHLRFPSVFWAQVHPLSSKTGWMNGEQWEKRGCCSFSKSVSSQWLRPSFIVESADIFEIMRAYTIN